MIESPWTRARKLRYQRQEDRLGRMEGGKKQINSGRTWRSKRDVVLHDFLIEARTTEKGSYRIEKKEFLQIEVNARQTPPGLSGAMQIDLGDLHLIALRLETFQDMFLRLRQLEEQYEQQV